MGDLNNPLLSTFANTSYSITTRIASSSVFMFFSFPSFVSSQQCHFLLMM